MPNLGSATQFFPRAVEGFTTTLASTISAGATTLTANSTAGYSVGDVIVWIIDPASSTAKQVLTGTVQTGNIITGIVWTFGTNQTHTAGATIVDYTTATGFDLVTMGILKHANQDGSLQQSSVLTAIGTGGITSTQLATNSVTAPKLATNAITLGSASITANISTQATSATQATGLTSTVTVPAGGRGLEITVSGGYLAVGTGSKNIYITLWRGTVGSGTQIGLAQCTQLTANFATPMTLVAIDTPSAGSTTYNVGYATDAGPVTLTWNVSSTSPAILLVKAI